MVLNKQFTILATFALLAGLLVGIVPFRNEFSVSQSYPLEVDVVYAYFRTFKVSEYASGLRNQDLVAYVFVLNVTNPTSEIIIIKFLEIHFAETACRFYGGGVEMRNTAVNYQREFYGSMDYFWYPNSSRIVAFSGTGELSNLGMAVLNARRGYFYASLGGATEKGHAEGSIIKMVLLDNPSIGEFVYNSVFKENERFHFSNYDIDISLEWAYVSNGE